MSPPALAMLVGAIGAPLLGGRVPPGVIMAGTLALSPAGYGAAGLGRDGQRDGRRRRIRPGPPGTRGIATLGTDIVMGAAPPDRSGSAAALSETVQEFGIAAGVALLGGLTTAIYHRDIETPSGPSPPEPFCRCRFRPAPAESGGCEALRLLRIPAASPGLLS